MKLKKIAYSFSEDEAKYLKAYRLLCKYHKRIYGKDKNPTFPNLFSEQICRDIFVLSKYQGRKFDAVDKKGRKCEIKGTCAPNTKSTFSLNKAARYFWIYIIPDKRIIRIYELNSKEICRKIDLYTGGKERINIDLLLVKRKGKGFIRF